MAVSEKEKTGADAPDYVILKAEDLYTVINH
jgi:hypothetical protein